MFNTIKESIEEQIIEKKSKFICNIFYVTSRKEVEEKLNIIKKKYYDARHNCFAYSLSDGEERFSDDGEPSGTAGAPMLNILTKNNLSNILVVVTRYFGGILLGTGGLVKAYSEATLKAIKSAQIVVEENGYEIDVELEYTNLENFKYFCNKQNINIVNIEYEKIIKVTIELSEQEEKNKILEKENIKSKIINYRIIKSKNIRKSK